MNATATTHAVLGDVGSEYVRTQLAEGGSLASRLAVDQRLRLGTVWAFVPEHWQPGCLEDLTSAPRFDVGVAVENQERTINFISEYLESGSSAVAVFEDQVRRVGDKSLQGRRFWTFEGTTYYLVRAEPGKTQDLVRQAKRSASKYPELIMLSNCPPRQVQHTEMTPEEGQVLLVGLQHVIVGAFDGEGYVIWSSQTSTR
jgi:hypothetical protein